MTITAKDAAAETCRQAFGALLTQQGRGYYVTLELLAIVWGTYRQSREILPISDRVEYLRRSHDFARRWMADEDLELPATASARQHVTGADGDVILRALLESLRVPIPNRRHMPHWLGQHLYPYVGELIHYDAVMRRKHPTIERYLYRGAGGLAHKILRTDDNSTRLEANRAGLQALVEDEGGPLGKLAHACAANDYDKGAVPFPDEIEQKSVVDETVWVEHLRDGVRNITQRDFVRAKKIELLMIWVPYAIARHQLDRASQLAHSEPTVLPVSLAQQVPAVRQVARRELDHAKGLVDEALQIQARRQESMARFEESEVYKGLSRKSSWRDPMVSFFTQTLATVGALNAMTGSRFLTLQLPLLEAIVCAALPPGEEVRFDEFCFDHLWSRYRLVVDHRSAASTGMTNRIDAADLTENADQLATDLNSLGLLTAYSDATRMVHGEVH
jgi:hypothetical protein